ncbi:MAG: hydroxyethylthiazole kinase-like uncharacterized protein yjeF [Candidatus Paceibacteria bacterium]|jgi:hydroxyethylthiazole kinase-like uncharacterized protein yjeF
MTEEELRTSKRPQPPPPLVDHAHKGMAGKVLCLAGSEIMPGAAILTVRGAQRAGAGLVTLATFDKSIIHAAAIAAPEAVYLDLSRTRDLVAGRLPSQLSSREDDARVAGPGLGKGGRTDELIRRLLEDEFDGPLVLDADGLNVIHDTPEVLAGCHGYLVVTPHSGEGARLLGIDTLPTDWEGRLDCAKSIARASTSTCVLKGYATVVTDGERSYVNGSGNSALATAGSGDVLSGVIGAYMAASRKAQNPDWGLFDAVCSAVYVHGLAGDLAAKEMGRRAVTASSVIQFLGLAQLELEQGTER